MFLIEVLKGRIVLQTPHALFIHHGNLQRLRITGQNNFMLLFLEKPNEYIFRLVYGRGVEWKISSEGDLIIKS